MIKTLKGLFFIGACLSIGTDAFGLSSSQYIKKYKDYAIEQMLVYNIPASITLAQGMLESECGSSPLAIYANNHFGIKCHDDWTGEYFVKDDDQRGEHFRKYQDADQSYHDHAEFLKSRPWYSFLFNYARTDYKDWAKGLAKAGYATASDYAQHLMRIIELNRLYVYDTVLQNLQGLNILYNVKGTSLQSKQCYAEYTVVKHGDCIYKISREFGIDVVTLCRNNGISLNDVLLPGRKIYLKARKYESSSAPVPHKRNELAAIIRSFKDSYREV
ncbi:MAG TPA: glucosaminidase domain-containing protein [Bacteroidia bacterium]|nr:glucosaminidase domain-containing protein [Bacteroidia bacterium]